MIRCLPNLAEEFDELDELHSEGVVGDCGVRGVLVPEVKSIVDILNWFAASQCESQIKLPRIV